MQAMHSSRVDWVSRPAVWPCSPARGLQAFSREQPQKKGASLGRSLAPDRQTQRQQRKTQTCAAVPQPVVDVADVSYYLQLASFAVLGGFVIYFTLNYVGLNITLNKAEKAKQKKAEEEAAKKKKGGLFGFGKK